MRRSMSKGSNRLGGPRATARLALLGAALAVTTLGIGVGSAHAQPAAEPEPEAATVVEAGATVGIEYTLTLADGTQVDTNVGGEALRFEQGAGQIIPGLDKELIGMAVGDSKQVTVTAEEGYGAVNSEAFTEVPIDQLPEDARTPGAELMARDEEGRSQRLRVHSVEGDTATLDFNHPLAGKELRFEMKILDVAPAA